MLAIDPAPAAAEVLQSQAPAHVAGRLGDRSVPAEDADLVPFDLLYAVLPPFLGADAFDRFWDTARERQRPGGILVVNFFSPRDSWAGREGMRFIDVDTVRPASTSSSSRSTRRTRTGIRSSARSIGTSSTSSPGDPLA